MILFQIGSIGLLKSVDKFDLSYDVKFSTYAVPMIIGEIQRFIRDDGTVKVSRSLKELSNRIRRARDELSKTKWQSADSQRDCRVFGSFSRRNYHGARCRYDHLRRSMKQFMRMTAIQSH